MGLMHAKERIVLGVATATLLANALLTLGNVEGLASVHRESARSQQVLTELARLEGTLSGAEAAQHQFLLSGGTTSLAPLEAARTLIGIQLDRLGELLRADGAQTARLAALGLTTRRRLAELNEEVRLFRAGARGPASTLAAAGAERSEGGPLRAELDVLEGSERAVLAALDATAARKRAAALASTLASTLLGFGFVVVALLVLRREVVSATASAYALERANAALKDLDRRKDEFLVSLAHELRNPLAAMRSAVELGGAVDGSADGKAQERRALARAVLSRQLSHLTRLVDDLLDLSRVTNSRVVLRKEALPLAEVVEAALETTRPAIEARRHSLAVHVPDDVVLVEADPVRLAQVVSNLLTNAAKYAPAGGHIELSVAADDAEAIVRVTDDGIGLAPQDLERVFGLFEQGAVRPDGDEGLGVGLALARRLAQLHGGSLSASSPGPGHGSTFTLRLPRASAPQRVEAPPEAPAAEAGPRRVLLVDDNVDGARSLAELLSVSGHDVHVASDGPSGLDAARRLTPDAIVLDLGLPGFDGYELARLVRAEPALAGTLLVSLSGWAGRDDRARAADAGIDHHLVKPAGAARIAELLATATPRPRT